MPPPARLAVRLLGAVLAALCAAPALAHPSWGLVVEPQGTIVFTDVDHNTVWRLERDGRLSPLARGVHSHELYRTPDGSLHGEHIAWDAANERWLGNLWRITPQGRFEELSPLAPQEPGGLAGSSKVRAPDGALYVTAAATLRRIAPGGTVTTVGGDPLGDMSHGARPRLLGLAVAPDRRVYVADYDHHAIREVAPTGTVRTLWSTGPLWSPTGVALTGPHLYVLEHRPEPQTPLGWFAPTARLRRLTLKSDTVRSATTLATVGSGSPLPLALLLLTAACVLLLAVVRLRSGKRKDSR